MCKPSIKEYCTKGMTLSERYKLYNKTDPIPLGEKVYRCGDAFEYTQEVTVDEKNQKEVSMFWNSLFFDNEKAADIETRRAHAAYGEYMFEGVC